MAETGKLPNGNLPVVEREIDGVPYKVTRLGWWDAQKSMGLINEIAGKALGEALRGASLNAEDLIIVLSSIPDAVARAAGSEGKALQTLWARQTVVSASDSNGENERDVALLPAVADIWFAQHPDHWIHWLRLSFEVQVVDFLRPASGLLDTARSLLLRGQEISRAEEPASQNT